MARCALLALVLAALGLTLGSASALAAPKLRATIAQATPTPSATPANGDELSEEPPNLGEEDDSDVSGGGSDSSGSGEGDGTDLPNTGADSLMLALMGLGLLVTGLGLRRRVAHAGLAR